MIIRKTKNKMKKLNNYSNNLVKNNKYRKHLNNKLSLVKIQLDQ